MSGKFDPGTTDRRIIRKSIIDYIFWEESENREFLEALAQLIDSGIKRLECFEAAEQMQIQNSELERKNMNYIKHKLPETREEWLAGRQKGLGGSDAGAILGLNPYKSPLQLWLEKTGQIDSNVPDNEAMWFGREAEELVAKRFEKETGKKVRRSGFSFQSEEHLFMLANVDRLVVGEKAGLECKTANFFADKEYEEGYIPEHYYAQCYHYMAVTGLDRWYLAVLIPGKSFHIYQIDRDEEQIRTLIEQEEGFWACVQEKKEPAAIDIDANILAKRYSNPQDEVITLYSDCEIDRLNEVKDLIKDLEKEKKGIENRLKQQLGDFTTGITSKGAIVTWKPVTSSRIDTKALKENEPEIYSRYLKETTSRRLTVKKGA